MLLTLTLEGDGTSGTDARDLGHLLRKHPARVQNFDASVGTVHVFYPHVSSERTTVAMLVEVDPIGLVRNKRFRGEAGSLDTYVNDRPYVASSLLTVALGSVFRSAMTGDSETHPELAARPLRLRIEIPVVATRGGYDQNATNIKNGENLTGTTDLDSSNKHPSLARRLFEPLGWQVDEQPIPLDDTRPEWGASRYSALSLSGQVRLAHALRQLYVLLPVLDDSKHYWVGDDEAAKLVRQGEGWLPGHPERELIANRYLAHQGGLVALTRVSDTAADNQAPNLPIVGPPTRNEGYANSAVSPGVNLGESPLGRVQLGTAQFGGSNPDHSATNLGSKRHPASVASGDAENLVASVNTAVTEPRSPDKVPSALRVQRAEAVLAVLTELGVHRVVDMGAGTGALLRRLQADRSYTDIVGVDVVARSLERAATRLGLTQASDAERARVTLLHGSAVYRDDRLRGYDAMVLMEVIEHIDESRLPALEDAVFTHAAPEVVIVTTPNRDYNALYPALLKGAMRHEDHRFEWSRDEFRDWAERVVTRHGYAVELRTVGSVDGQLGSPTQMAVFRKVRA